MDHLTLKKIKNNYQQVLLVFVAFVAMILVSVIYVSNIVRNQMQTIGEELMSTMEANVSGSLKASELLFASAVQSMDSYIKSGAELGDDMVDPYDGEDYVQNTEHNAETGEDLPVGNTTVKEKNLELYRYIYKTQEYFTSENSPMDGFMKIYGYIQGEFLDSTWNPTAGYVPWERPWYIGALETGGVYFSEPYQDADSGRICVSFSRALEDSKDVPRPSVISIDLELSVITEFVSGTTLANNGYGILLSDTMVLYAHRLSGMTEQDMYGLDITKFDSGAGAGELDSKMRKNFAKTKENYAGLANRIEKEKTLKAVRFTDYDNTDSVIFVSTIFNGWHLGVITPRASYYRNVSSLIVVISIVGVALMAALSTVLVRTRNKQMRADEENRSKSEFLSRMSHEMRTPMNAIIGMTNIAKGSGDVEKMEYCLERISDASTHLLGVINDILDMSKIAAGKLELSDTEFLLSDVFRQAISVLNFKLEEKKQNFRLNVDASVPKAVIADRQRLAQVIANLLSNANKFTPEGGDISLSVRTLSNDGKTCVIEMSVADSGIGISEQQQARLFRSFEQADGSISRKYGGTGLGLVISKNIVELMGGSIRVESQPDEGSNFIFTIRAGVGSEERILAAENEEVKDDGNTDFTGKNILLAEDLDINREIVLSMLEETNVNIDCAENGKEAVEMFLADPDKYDLIFMDVHMPEVDGYEATRRIRAMDLPQARAVPIVAMTANVFREDVEKSLAAGMNGHIGKPIEFDAVLGMMRQFIK